MFFRSAVDLTGFPLNLAFFRDPEVFKNTGLFKIQPYISICIDKPITTFTIFLELK